MLRSEPPNAPPWSPRGSILVLSLGLLAACGGGDDGSGRPSGGSGQPIAGPTALAKFCHAIGFGPGGAPEAIELRLDVGTAPNLVSLSALTGACTPVDDEPCVAVPAGERVPLLLVDVGADDSVIASGTLTSMPDQAWIVLADVDRRGQPFIGGSLDLDLGGDCRSLRYDDVFPPPAQ